MAQKVVLRVASMNDQRSKKKAMEAVAKIHGIHSISADLKEQKVTVVGEMDPIVVAQKLRKIGSAEIITVNAS